ncbi:MAG: manganese efflux pump [Spirochaetales bacterium]|nr:manganese efflux pump [Spirochaetales bacterium]
MTSLAVIGIAFSLSMDAFAASVSTGCSMTRIKKRTVLATAFAFGAFQGIMPIAGYYAGLTVRSFLLAWEHWVAFGLLFAIGAKMVYEGIREGKKAGCEDSEELLSVRRLLWLSIATSIDALIIGVGFAVLDISVFMPAAVIAGVTFVMSGIGVITGKVLKHVFSEYVDILGGIILIGLSIKILVEHFQ